MPTLEQELTRLMNQIERKNSELEHINSVDMPAVFEVDQDIHRRIRQLQHDMRNSRIPTDQLRERSAALRQITTNLMRTSDELFARRERLVQELGTLVEDFDRALRNLH